MTWKTIMEYLTLSSNEIELAGELQHDSSQHALMLTFADGDSEVLSIDLISFGYVASPGEVFVGDYSEHSGLPAALVTAGICELVDTVQVGQFGSAVARMRMAAA